MSYKEKFNTLYKDLNDDEKVLLIEYITENFGTLSAEGFSVGPIISLNEGRNVGPNTRMSEKSICPTCKKPI